MEASLSALAKPLVAIGKTLAPRLKRLQAERRAADDFVHPRTDLINLPFDETLSRLENIELNDTWWRRFLQQIETQYVRPDYLAKPSIREWLAEACVRDDLKTLAASRLLHNSQDDGAARARLSQCYSMKTLEASEAAVGVIDAVVNVLLAGALAEVGRGDLLVAAMIQSSHDAVVSRLLQLGEQLDKRIAGNDQRDKATKIKIAPSRLPRTQSLLVGRGKELGQLTRSLKRQRSHIVCVIAWGGVGKSALVSHWRTLLAKGGWTGLERVFDWSFYSQGSSEDRLASAEAFIEAASKWFGVDTSGGTASDKGERLASAVTRYRTLLILDGLEPLQYEPRGNNKKGTLKSPELAAFLKCIADNNNGLCIITSRQPIAELQGYEGSTVELINLKHLSTSAGVKLLRATGVAGEDRLLEQAATEFGGHALALNLLGTYIRDSYNGDVRRYRDIDLLDEDAEQGAQARRVVRSYEKWFGPSAELDVLRVLGLFDRPATTQEIRSLLGTPPIPDLTENLAIDFPPNAALARLVKAQLITIETKPQQQLVLDAHPIVRQYFADSISRNYPASWREAHRRLYVYLRSKTERAPDTVDGMMPLFAAVQHGCFAGLQEEAFKSVYEPRIKVGELIPDARRFGGFSTNLSVVSGFFERRWDRPSKNLTLETRDEVLNEAGFGLRALGRLWEAKEPLQAALKGTLEQADFEKGAMIAGNLGELNMILGDFEAAIAFANQGVDAGEQSGKYWRHWWTQVAKRADIFFNMGKADLAAEGFIWAERTQRDHDPDNPYLYGVLSFKYCEFLKWQIEQRLQRENGGVSLQVIAYLERRGPGSISSEVRAMIESLKERVRRQYALDIGRGIALHVGLEELCKGSLSWLLDTVHSGTLSNDAKVQLLKGENAIRHAGREEYIPIALLNSATAYLLSDEWARASSYIERARDIARYCGLKLQEIDAMLCAAYLHGRRGEVELARQIAEKTSAAAQQSGYHRRDKELRSLLAWTAKACADGRSLV